MLRMRGSKPMDAPAFDLDVQTRGGEPYYFIISDELEDVWWAIWWLESRLNSHMRYFITGNPYKLMKIAREMTLYFVLVLMQEDVLFTRLDGKWDFDRRVLE